MRRRTLKTLTLITLFLGVCGSAFAGPDTYLQVPLDGSAQPTHPVTETGVDYPPEPPSDFSGIDYTTITLHERTDIDTVTAMAKEIVKTARSQNQNLGRITLTVTLSAPHSPAEAKQSEPVKLADIVQDNVENIDVMVFVPTKDLKRGIKRPPRNLYLEHADRTANRIKARFSIARAFINGTITSINLFADDHNLVPSLFGGVTMGVIAYMLQMYEVRYAMFIEGPASMTWDRDGELHISDHIGWKLAYDGWKTLKHFGAITCFLTAVSAAYMIGEAMVGLDATPLVPQLKPMVAIAGTAALSALSFGRLKRNQTQWMYRENDINGIVNYANRAEGYRRAEEIATWTQLSAFTISAISVAFETVSFMSGWNDVAFKTMLGVTAAAWGAHFWSLFNMQEKSAGIKQTVREGLGATKKAVCSYIFGGGKDKPATGD